MTRQASNVGAVLGGEAVVAAWLVARAVDVAASLVRGRSTPFGAAP